MDHRADLLPLQARGYGGGRTVVKDYVRTQRPRAIGTAEARFYVKPGQQLQLDWVDMGVVTVGEVQRKLIDLTNTVHAAGHDHASVGRLKY